MSDLQPGTILDAEPVIPVQRGSGRVPVNESASLWADARRELLRKPTFVLSALYLLVVASMALVPRLWTSRKPDQCDIHDGTLPMSAEHPFGTSPNGCDYYAHAVYGAFPSLSIAFMATVGVVLIGVTLGMVSGYYGGWIDAVISRITDTILSLPFLLGALVFLTVLKKFNIFTIALVLIALGWTGMTRLMRGSVLSTKALDYVQAARAMGASDARVMFRHILPNAIAPVIVVATVSLGAFVATEATLTFLGAGLQPPAASWGVMIATHEPYFNDQPHLVLIPVGLLVGTVLSFILMGDALRDALDPRLR
jgi:ABC-type dipeptide/oligopeptide/nickel transport system permease subunit